MSSSYRVLSAEERSRLHDSGREFALDVLTSLSEQPKRLPSKYFYDDEGSRLFQKIMGLGEYYPTGCEREILENHGRSIVASCPQGPMNLIDLGAGDGAKTRVLIDHLHASGADFRYVPLDISEGAIRELAGKLEADYPWLEIEGLVCDYADGLAWLAQMDANRTNVVLFLGSNLGNFDRARSRAFLRLLWTSLRDGDYVLVGFDLKKDIDVLLHAYNDAEGVTAAFNLNLLSRINRELGADFRLEAFRHFGTYDVFSGAMKSYLVSLEQQRVDIAALGRTFDFEPWEPVLTEYSYKYLESDITDLAEATGFAIDAIYRDSRRYFADALWRVVKTTAP